MDISSRLRNLYLLNATVLISHEIDSAYWHEWQLFHIPGGIQLFLFLHLLLLPLVLYGYREVSVSGRYAKLASILLASTGLFAALVHGAFILSGDSAFSLPMSQVLLLATLILSSLQLIFVLTDSNRRESV